MTKRIKRLFAQISKTEQQDDGTIKVWGYASSNAVDSDGETITSDAMKAAIPDYMKFGAVREMHKADAAGTAIECSVEADGKTWFGAHVVDPIAVKKVETGVYKGFSIGGKVTERDSLDRKIIKGLNLIEVSLVDRPANPEAVITVMKADRTVDDDVTELADLLDVGDITPAQILALVKASKVEEPVVEEVKKGMYSLVTFADVLCNIAYLASDTAWEAEYEQDGSPLPAALQAWLKTGLELFQSMAKEEADELMASLSNMAGKSAKGLNIAKAAAALVELDTVAKAGARFSKATKSALGAVHEACKAAAAHLDDLKYADDSVEESDTSGTLTKTVVPPVADTIGIDQEALNKAIAPLNESLAKLTKENADLEAKVNAMSKRAAPGKALLKAMEKAEDVQTGVVTKVVEPTAPEGTVERAQQEMVKVFQVGGKLLVPAH